MKVLAKNRRATYDYEIKDKLIAGVSLSGAEVKSIKAGHVNLAGSYVALTGGEAFLIGAHVSPYKHNSTANIDPERTRKLLLNKSEIEKLGTDRQNGLTAVALALLLSKNLIKLEIGIGKGKKQHDKRQTIKKRQFDRDQAKQFKN